MRKYCMYQKEEGMTDEEELAARKEYLKKIQAEKKFLQNKERANGELSEEDKARLKLCEMIEKAETAEVRFEEEEIGLTPREKKIHRAFDDRGPWGVIKEIGGVILFIIILSVILGGCPR